MSTNTHPGGTGEGGVANPGIANEAAAAFADQKRGAAAEHGELEAVRQDLENHDEPHDDAPESVDAETDDAPGYSMSVDRRIGSTHLDVEYYAPGDEDPREVRLKFGKPNGRSSTALFAPIEEAEETEGQSVNELTEYIWGTLAEWCLDDDAPGVEQSPAGPDYWAERMGLGDAIQVLQNLALGIDPNGS